MIRPVVVVALCLIFLTANTVPALAAGPKVDIVTGPKPPALEATAASELVAQLTRLYKAEVKVNTEIPARSENLILLGSPETNPAVKALGAAWPKLTEQGHLLRTVEVGGRKALLIGGSKPVATLWAVHELGYQSGVRSLLFGDIDPAEPTPFKIEGFDTVLEPVHPVRTWKTVGNSPLGAVSWGIADQKPLLMQLVKAKFNRVVLSLDTQQPFLQKNGKTDAVPTLAVGFPFRVNGDTAGRGAFGGLKQFQNPDFAGKLTPAEWNQAGQNYLRELIASAKTAGLDVTLHFTGTNAEEAGKEFSRVAGAIATGNYVSVDDQLTQASLTKDGRQHVASLVLGMNSVGPLPQADQNMAAGKIQAMVQQSGAKDGQRQYGFIVEALNPSDIGPLMHYLSRAGFDPTITPAVANKLLVDAACGSGTDSPMQKGLDRLQKATAGIATNDPEFVPFGSDFLLKEYHSGKPAPKWWADVQNDYLEAMNEMYRANGHSREDGRVLTLYFCRRMEFGYEYFNILTALRNAGIARDKKDTETQIAELEKAVDSFNGGLNAMAAVSRTPSDRAVIAVMNAYGYHPVKAELEKLLDAQ